MNLLNHKRVFSSVKVMHLFEISLFLLIPITVFGQDNIVKLHVFYTNDIQSQISPQKATFLNPEFPPSLGGGASMVSVLNHYRRTINLETEKILLFDGGDFHNPASPLGEASKGKASVEFMNLLGYTALVPGNLDFEPGIKNLLDLAGLARFPFLASNLADINSKNPPKPIRSSIKIDFNGIKIGVFGITSKSAEHSIPEDETIQFLNEIETAGETIKSLKQSGTDVIIALTHLGLPGEPDAGYKAVLEMERMKIKKAGYVNAMELAHFVSGIDLLISGKIHRGYDFPWEDPVNHTICVQNYAYGGNLGLITLLIDINSKTITGYELPSDDGGLLLLNTEQFWPDPEMLEKISEIEKRYTGSLDSIIGVTRNTIYRRDGDESPMANLMCDAMITATGADFSFNNFTGMRADIPIGPITLKDIANVFPFGNKIVVIKMTGQLLKDIIESSVAGYYSGLAIGGGQIVIDKNRRSGDRVVEFTINGKTIEPERNYRLATTEYLAEGNYGMDKLTFLADDHFSYTDKRVRDAVKEYVIKYTPLTIAIDGRWKILNK
ncbi:MAG: bifunctional metallophosphatase/5'-nucleotidase [Calditrichaceae bacterium]|nr:bifunctional metallophosphatase/5'-nucleotidase [Calditrichaceae bacterium]MBN2708291.1 bifunctional metallophosphatase/5'-nucleotidase [Calditrichaceae bacterium]RQV91933.1 MAG: bifunctional metallophosphatase/5'-nucleotidase [Calditrichota bacterium]